MTRTIPMRFTLAIALLLLLPAACSSPPEPVPASPEPTPSVLMKPIPADDDARFYGIGTPDVKSDSYGDYAALAVVDTTFTSDLTGVTIDQAVYEHFDQEAIERQAVYAADFLVGSYIDTPLVFDDSESVREQYWADTDVKWASVDFMRTHFDERPDGGAFVLVDDDRGLWRQTGDPAYEPVPYVAGQPRTKVQKFRLVAVDYEAVEWRGEMRPTLQFRFEMAYDREVVLKGGQEATEHTSGWVTVELGRLDGFKGSVIGLKWGRSTWLGHYIEGGAWGLNVLEPAVVQVDDSFRVGDALDVVAPEGFLATSNLTRAKERGIQVEMADAPDLEVAYYEGQPFGDPDDENFEYVVTVYDPSPVPDNKRASYLAREQAGELDEAEFFVPLGGEAFRLTGKGVKSGWLTYSPAMFDETMDRVSVLIESSGGPTYEAMYWVEAGRGPEVLQLLKQGWRFGVTKGDLIDAR